MKRKLWVRVAAVVAVVAMCAFVGGCAHTTGSKEVKVEPKVSADALVAEGTLTVGIDSTLSPFGGESDGQVIGVDVDVAAALASELGLDLQVVDTSGKNAVSMLGSGEIDVAMNISPTQSTSGVAVIGPYLDNGPALFGTAVIDNLDSIKGHRIGATKNSLAATSALGYCDPDDLAEFPSIAEAFDALDNGQIEYVASDAVAGGYLALTAHEDVVYAISLANPSGTYIGVKQDNTALQDSVVEALKAITGNGVLQVVAAKWTGVDCAEHVLMPADQISSAKIEKNDSKDLDDDDDESSDDEEQSDEDEDM